MTGILMKSAYPDQQEEFILARGTLGEHEIEYAQGWPVLPITDKGKCVRNVTDDGSLNLDGLACNGQGDIR